MANKKEYALANKQWLEEKAKEEGVYDGEEKWGGY